MTPFQAYWCALPVPPMEFESEEKARLATEAAYGCGALASSEAAWMIALLTASAVAFGIAWRLTAEDDWDKWPMLILAPVAGLLWWVVLPLAALAIPVGLGVAIPRARIATEMRRRAKAAAESRAIADADDLLRRERVL